MLVAANTESLISTRRCQAWKS